MIRYVIFHSHKSAIKKSTIKVRLWHGSYLSRVLIKDRYLHHHEVRKFPINGILSSSLQLAISELIILGQFGNRSKVPVCSSVWDVKLRLCASLGEPIDRSFI